MSGACRAIGGIIFRHRLGILAFWTAALALAWPGARRASHLLDAGSGKLTGTPSAHVEEILAREFSNPFSQCLAVTFESREASGDDPEFRRALGQIADQLRHAPGVARVVLPGEAFGDRFHRADGHALAVLIGLSAASTDEAERLVPGMRESVRAALPPGGLPGWDWHVTGRTAMLHDLNLFNAADSQRAERRALPWSLLVLVLVFGSLVAAALPLALGLASTLLALSLVPALVPLTPLNILYQNIVTLLGLALGIDYSLFIVSRYREQRGAGEDRAAALAVTMATAGRAVAYSGCTVLIGLGGLLLTPLLELRSIGLGGMAVVAMSLLLSLTCLPALLAVLDPWLGAPARLAAALRLGGSRRRWMWWTALVVRHPVIALLSGLGFLLVLCLPLLAIKPGFPATPWLPAAMESTRGFAALQRMGVAQELMPIQLLVRATDRGALLPQHLDAFLALSGKLRHDSRVARVFGPVDLGAGLGELEYRALYLDLNRALAQYPVIGELTLSRGRDAALLQVILKDGTSYEDSLAASRELAALVVPGLTLKAGGHWPSCQDFDATLLAAYPAVFGAVVAATLLVLLWAFRSVLVPIKALLLNALSVCAAFGAIVAVFQWGWGAHWLGLTEPTGAIPLMIPLIVFCLTFGLSMDYEIFILSRVREEYLHGGEADLSVQRGLIATGALVSGAAAVMVVVFGAFALAGVVIVKMLGFGLAVAVAVDALVVRAMMVPAAMKLAGRWNWWPGLK